MNSSDVPCPCGSGQVSRQCCVGVVFAGLDPDALLVRPPPEGLDEVLTEAYVHAQRLLASPDVLRRMAECMALLRGMFRPEGPLAALRWPWEEFVPAVERHIFRVMAEVEDIEERQERLFLRCAPDLLDAERLDRLDDALRRELMSSERTPVEKSALAVAVLELLSAPRRPPFSREGLSAVSWLMMEQVDEWVARRQRVQAVVNESLGRGGGPSGSGGVVEPEALEAALERAARVDPEVMALLGQYEEAIVRGILEGRTPGVLHGEEWLWAVAVLREPVGPEALRILDAGVHQAVLGRLEAAARDRTSPAEAEQWFCWAYKVLVSRPAVFFGTFAQAREAVLLERFSGESEEVHTLRWRERWRAEDLEPYRLRLEALGASGAARCVGRLQAWLRGEAPVGGWGFKT